MSKFMWTDDVIRSAMQTVGVVRFVLQRSGESSNKQELAKQLVMNSHHWPGDQSVEYIKRENGGIHISAKALRIVWGNDSRFWQWTKIEDSCFEIGAELIQVNWLEVNGALDLQKFPLDPLKAYEIVYVVKFMADAFGWHAPPITFEVCSAWDGKKSRRAETLEHYYLKEEKKKSWIEIHGGEFSLPSAASNYNKIEFGMNEVKTEWWKGGIVLEGVKITPKHTPLRIA
ncbi:putative F-box protein PP2-B2 [Platanthera zijinensis]|uniref:F-box protein PP2-B2 n=1 Tax=Platanthera zijinensis TaxID=2320716 RepID=A0AAP0BWQ7_9ASPA